MRNPKNKSGLLYKIVVRSAMVNRHLSLIILCAFYSFTLTLLFVILGTIEIYLHEREILIVAKAITFFFLSATFIIYIGYAISYRKNMLPKINNVQEFSEKLIGQFQKLTRY